MENGNLLENLAIRLGQQATVKNVYGEPVTAGGKTVIPVAKLAYGFGGGTGRSKNGKFRALPEGESEKTGQPEGAGGGGGLRATATGVFEISDQGTKFIPANNSKQLLVAAVIGFMLRGWLMRRK